MFWQQRPGQAGRLPWPLAMAAHPWPSRCCVAAWQWQVLRAYALILTHPGTPCVFHWDYALRQNLLSSEASIEATYLFLRVSASALAEVRAPYVREKLLELCPPRDRVDAFVSLWELVCQLNPHVGMISKGQLGATPHGLLAPDQPQPPKPQFLADSWSAHPLLRVLLRGLQPPVARNTALQDGFRHS